jgi:hypothetical protein
MYDEILRTYALLFTRDESSKKIAQTLFKERNAELYIATGENPEEDVASNVVLKSLPGEPIVPTGRCVIIPD